MLRSRERTLLNRPLVHDARRGARRSQRSLSLRPVCCWFLHHKARTLVRLLGPCFKMGGVKPYRQHPQRAEGRAHADGAHAPRHCMQSRSAYARVAHARLARMMALASCPRPRRVRGARRRAQSAPGDAAVSTQRTDDADWVAPAKCSGARERAA